MLHENFFDDFFVKFFFESYDNFFYKFFDDFFDEIFHEMFLYNNLLTNANFRIAVPLIVFLETLKVQDGSLTKRFFG